MINILIEIEWQGGYSIEDIYKLNDRKSDFGLYFIYGNHPLNGCNTLQYIGQACNQTFSVRLKQHKGWTDNEPSNLIIYIGRIGRNINDNFSLEEWSNKIDIAEKLLIYYLSPPYNSSLIHNKPNLPKTLVLNFGKRFQLPYCLTSLYYDHNYYIDKKLWKLYSDPNSA